MKEILENFRKAKGQQIITQSAGNVVFSLFVSCMLFFLPGFFQNVIVGALIEHAICHVTGNCWLMWANV